MEKILHILQNKESDLQRRVVAAEEHTRQAVARLDSCNRVVSELRRVASEQKLRAQGLQQELDDLKAGAEQAGGSPEQGERLSKLERELAVAQIHLEALEKCLDDQVLQATALRGDLRSKEEEVKTLKKVSVSGSAMSFILSVIIVGPQNNPVLGHAFAYWKARSMQFFVTHPCGALSARLKLNNVISVLELCALPTTYRM